MARPSTCIRCGAQSATAYGWQGRLCITCQDAPGAPTRPAETVRQQYRKCGKPGCSTCATSPGHGPYWYAYWTEDGRTRSRYIGKIRPPAEPGNPTETDSTNQPTADPHNP